MRRMVLPLVLAAGIASTVALAANDRVTATFQSLSASGVSGEAALKTLPQGGTMIHASLRGLDPNTQYVSYIYDNGTCASGTSTEVIRFTANPAGIANYNRKVSQSLTDIESISVQLVSDQTLQACASVTP